MNLSERYSLIDTPGGHFLLHIFLPLPTLKHGDQKVPHYICIALC